MTLNGNCGRMQPNHSAEARKAPLRAGEAELSQKPTGSVPQPLLPEVRGARAVGRESTRRGLSLWPHWWHPWGLAPANLPSSLGSAAEDAQHESLGSLSHPPSPSILSPSL